MDRLHSLTFLLLTSLAFLACDEGQAEQPAPAPVSRFEAVAAKPKADPFEDFCDVRPAQGQGPKLTLPATDTAPAQTTGSQWLNLWATWCKPCVEELPMIAGFQQRMTQANTPLTVHFVSVDTTAEAVAQFRSQHPGMPDTMRLVDADGLAPYVESLGLGAGTGLPVHVFAGPDGRIRCVRSGAVLQSHYDTIALLMR